MSDAKSNTGWTIPRALWVMAAGNSNEVDALLAGDADPKTTKWREGVERARASNVTGRRRR